MENQVIVKYKKEKIDLKSSTGKNKKEKIQAKLKTIKSESLDDLNISLIKSEKTTEELLQELEGNPDIEIAEPNYKRHSTLSVNDAYFASQWYLNNTGQDVEGTSGTNDADIDAPEAWETEPSLTNTNIVAVIDSGVQYNHVDLNDNMWDGSSSCKDENNNPISGGCPNHGWDFENNDNDPNDEYDAEDEGTGHGTFVAGIIGAETNNSSGISGLSYNNKTKIMALRFNFDTFSEVRAINFAKNNGAKVINASFSGESYSQIEKDAIDSFEGIFIAASGNGGADGIGDNNDLTPQYPASYTSPNIISVAATDQNDILTDFSNYGATSVDIAAPGEKLVSTYNSTINSYAIANGTSGSAPIVAGITAVLWQKSPTLSISEIKNVILNNGDLKASLNGKIVSGKRVNFKESLRTLGSATAKENSAPVYRYSNINLGAYFFTSSIFEKQDVDENGYGFTYQGVGYYAFDHDVTGSSPVYRFANPDLGIYFFTTSPIERDYLLNNDPGFTYQGVGFYAYNYAKAGTTPVYRFANRNTGFYFYTSSIFEKDDLLENGYGFEYQGVGFYAYNYEY